MNKYKVLTDHWKANLFNGDIIPGSMYSPEVLERADKSGYIKPFKAEKPTMSNTKKEIEDYLESNNISFSEYATKSELLDLI